MTIDTETRLRYAKTGVNLIVSHSVAAAVSTIISQNINTEDLKRRKKLEVAIGTRVIGKMVGAQTKPFVDKRFDSAVRLYTAVKKKLDESDNPETPQD